MNHRPFNVYFIHALSPYLYYKETPAPSIGLHLQKCVHPVHHSLLRLYLYVLI